MKAYEAAIQILTEAEKPLHVNEITTRILKSGLWQSRGKTPEATVGPKSTPISRTTRQLSLCEGQAPDVRTERCSSTHASPLGLSPHWYLIHQLCPESAGRTGRRTTDALQGYHVPGLAKGWLATGRQDARSQHVRPSDLRDQAAAETG